MLLAYFRYSCVFLNKYITMYSLFFFSLHGGPLDLFSIVNQTAVSIQSMLHLLFPFHSSLEQHIVTGLYFVCLCQILYAHNREVCLVNITQSGCECDILQTQVAMCCCVIAV